MSHLKGLNQVEKLRKYQKCSATLSDACSAIRTYIRDIRTSLRMHIRLTEKQEKKSETFGHLFRHTFGKPKNMRKSHRRLDVFSEVHSLVQRSSEMVKTFRC